MKTNKGCKNCFYYEQCGKENKRCEYYDPLYNSDSVILKEYKDSLKERVEEYNDLVNEQQG